MRMATDKVAAKVWASALAALATPIVLALLARAFPDVPLPVDAGDLVQTVILAAIGGAVTLATGYYKRPAPADKVVDERPE